MIYAFVFLVHLFAIELVWKLLEYIIYGYLTPRLVDLYIAILWAGSLTYAIKDKLR